MLLRELILCSRPPPKQLAHLLTTRLSTRMLGKTKQDTVPFFKMAVTKTLE